MNIKTEGVPSATDRSETMSLSGHRAWLDAGHLSNVALSLRTDDAVGYRRDGDDLIVVLANGETLILVDYFLDDMDGKPVVQLLETEVGDYVDSAFDNNSTVSAQPAPAGDDEDGSGVWLGADLDVAAGAAVALGTVAGAALLGGGFDDDDKGLVPEAESTGAKGEDVKDHTVDGTDKADHLEAGKDDQVDALNGNDTITVNSLDFKSIDGGQGFDTVVLAESIGDISPQPQWQGHIHNIEKIDLSNGNHNLGLNSAFQPSMIKDITNDSNTLYFYAGEPGDKLHLGEDFTQGDQPKTGDPSGDTKTSYNTYTVQYDSSTVTVYVDQNITVVFS